MAHTTINDLQRSLEHDFWQLDKNDALFNKARARRERNVQLRIHHATHGIHVPPPGSALIPEGGAPLDRARALNLSTRYAGEPHEVLARIRDLRAAAAATAAAGTGPGAAAARSAAKERPWRHGMLKRPPTTAARSGIHAPTNTPTASAPGPLHGPVRPASAHARAGAAHPTAAAAASADADGTLTGNAAATDASAETSTAACPTTRALLSRLQTARSLREKLAAPAGAGTGTDVSSGSLTGSVAAASALWLPAPPADAEALLAAARRVALDMAPSRLALIAAAAADAAAASSAAATAAERAADMTPPSSPRAAAAAAAASSAAVASAVSAATAPGAGAGGGGLSRAALHRLRCIVLRWGARLAAGEQFPPSAAAADGVLVAVDAVPRPGPQQSQRTRPAGGAAGRASLTLVQQQQLSAQQQQQLSKRATMSASDAPDATSAAVTGVTAAAAAASNRRSTLAVPSAAPPIAGVGPGTAPVTPLRPSAQHRRGSAICSSSLSPGVGPTPAPPGSFAVPSSPALSFARAPGSPAAPVAASSSASVMGAVDTVAAAAAAATASTVAAGTRAGGGGVAPATVFGRRAWGPRGWPLRGALVFTGAGPWQLGERRRDTHLFGFAWAGPRWRARGRRKKSGGEGVSDADTDSDDDDGDDGDNDDDDAEAAAEAEAALFDGLSSESSRSDDGLSGFDDTSCESDAADGPSTSSHAHARTGSLLQGASGFWPLQLPASARPQSPPLPPQSPRSPARSSARSPKHSPHSQTQAQSPARVPRPPPLPPLLGDWTGLPALRQRRRRRLSARAPPLMPCLLHPPVSAGTAAAAAVLPRTALGFAGTGGSAGAVSSGSSKSAHRLSIHHLPAPALDAVDTAMLLLLPRRARARYRAGLLARMLAQETDDGAQAGGGVALSTPAALAPPSVSGLVGPGRDEDRLSGPRLSGLRLRLRLSTGDDAGVVAGDEGGDVDVSDDGDDDDDTRRIGSYRARRRGSGGSPYRGEPEVGSPLAACGPFLALHSTRLASPSSLAGAPSPHRRSRPPSSRPSSGRPHAHWPSSRGGGGGGGGGSGGGWRPPVASFASRLRSRIRGVFTGGSAGPDALAAGLQRIAVHRLLLALADDPADMAVPAAARGDADADAEARSRRPLGPRIPCRCGGVLCRQLFSVLRAVYLNYLVLRESGLHYVPHSTHIADRLGARLTQRVVWTERPTLDSMLRSRRAAAADSVDNAQAQGGPRARSHRLTAALPSDTASADAAPAAAAADAGAAPPLLHLTDLVAAAQAARAAAAASAAARRTADAAAAAREIADEEARAAALAAGGGSGAAAAMGAEGNPPLAYVSRHPFARAPDAVFLAVAGAAGDTLPQEEVVARAAAAAAAGSGASISAAAGVGMGTGAGGPGSARRPILTQPQLRQRRPMSASSLQASADGTSESGSTTGGGGGGGSGIPASLATHVRELLTRPRTSTSKLVNYSIPRGGLAVAAAAAVAGAAADGDGDDVGVAAASGAALFAASALSPSAASASTGGSSSPRGGGGGRLPIHSARKLEARRRDLRRMRRAAGAVNVTGPAAAAMVLSHFGPGRAPPREAVPDAAADAATRAAAADLERVAPTHALSKNMFATALSRGRLPVAQYRGDGIAVTGGEISGSLGFVDGAPADAILTPAGAAGPGATAAMVAVTAAAANTAAALASGTPVTRTGERILAAFTAHSAAAAAALAAGAGASGAAAAARARAFTAPPLPAEAVYAVSQGAPEGRPDHALWQRADPRARAGAGGTGSSGGGGGGGGGSGGGGRLSAEDEMIRAHFAPADDDGDAAAAATAGVAAVAAAAGLEAAAAAAGGGLSDLHTRHVHQTTRTVTLQQIRTQVRIHTAGDRRARSVARFLPESFGATPATAATAMATAAIPPGGGGRTRSRARAAAAAAAAGLLPAGGPGSGGGDGCGGAAAALLALGRSEAGCALDEDGLQQVARAFKRLEDMNLDDEAAEDATVVARRRLVEREVSLAQQERRRAVLSRYDRSNTHIKGGKVSAERELLAGLGHSGNEGGPPVSFASNFTLANAPYRSQSFRFVQRNIAGEDAAAASAAAARERDELRLLREVQLSPPDHQAPAHTRALRPQSRKY